LRRYLKVRRLFSKRLTRSGSVKQDDKMSVVTLKGAIIPKHVSFNVSEWLPIACSWRLLFDGCLLCQGIVSGQSCMFT